MRKVLIVTASFGDGHNQAAYAVGEALKNQGHVVKIVDYMEWLHPAVRSFAKFSLMQGVQKIPVLYGFFYNSMSRIQPSSSIQKQLNHLGISHLKHWLKQFGPDVVVSTFPTPNGLMSELRTSGITEIPSAAVVTDYTVHGQWIQPDTDLYFVAVDDLKQELCDFGVTANQIAVTGIPIRSRFASEQIRSLLSRRSELRLRHKLMADAPVIMMMGGGEGLFGDVHGWEQIIHKVNAQFVIVCGRNERLYKRMQQMESNRIRVLGYTEDVDVWMSMSDLLITKPGGITVTEALSTSLPMLLYRPIPGQEERNARYVVGTGAAKLAYELPSAEAFLREAVANPRLLVQMRERAATVHKDGAAQMIATELIRLADTKTRQNRVTVRLQRTVSHS